MKTTIAIAVVLVFVFASIPGSARLGCPARPAAQSGYEMAIAESLQDVVDLAAVLHSSGQYIETVPVGQGCYGVVYCQPGPNSACTGPPLKIGGWHQ